MVRVRKHRLAQREAGEKGRMLRVVAEGPREKQRARRRRDREGKSCAARRVCARGRDEEEGGVEKCGCARKVCPR